MSRDVRVVVLYEDEQRSKFVRKLVRRQNLRPERFERCGGCGDVLLRFVRELAAMRPRMSFQKNLALIVVIDADAPTIEARLADLNKAIADSASGGPRNPSERIVFLIPALEIENWYLHLCVPAARPVDESRDYKPDPAWRELNRALGAAARLAVERWHPESGREDPASMVAAREELKRL